MQNVKKCYWQIFKEEIKVRSHDKIVSEKDLKQSAISRKKQQQHQNKIINKISSQSRATSQVKKYHFGSFHGKIFS